MKTIYKYPLVVALTQTVRLPIGNEILHAGFDANKTLCLWAQVDTKATVFEEVEVHVVPTGGTIPENVEYFDTVMLGGFVWHIFF